MNFGVLLSCCWSFQLPSYAFAFYTFFGGWVPDPGKCGFGTDISLKNPPNVFVPTRQIVETCKRIEVDRIITTSELEALNLSQWIEVCDSLGG